MSNIPAFKLVHVSFNDELLLRRNGTNLESLRLHSRTVYNLECVEQIFLDDVRVVVACCVNTNLSIVQIHCDCLYCTYFFKTMDEINPC